MTDGIMLSITQERVDWLTLKSVLAKGKSNTKGYVQEHTADDNNSWYTELLMKILGA